MSQSSSTGSARRRHASRSEPAHPPSQPCDFGIGSDFDIDALLDTNEWSLIGCFGDGQGLQEVEIDKQPFTIGRRDCNDLPLGSKRVSGRHAELMRVGDHLLLRDLSSTNGTFVQGNRVTDVTPVGDGDLIQIADVEMKLRWTAEVAAPVIQSMENTAVELDAFDDSWLFTNFEKLIGRPGIIPFYQSVVRFSDNETVGFEVLARSNIEGLETPLGMFTTAETLGRETELSHQCRQRGVSVAQHLAERHGYNVPVLLNTHPAEDLLDEVLPHIAELGERYSSVPLVLEIHEAAFTSVPEMRTLAKSLDELGVDLAYDDFGAGQSRLIELLEVPPKYLKFDRSIIQAMEEPGGRQMRMVEHLLGMMTESGIRTLAEGVETEHQARLCRDVGFELAQGYLFGRPQPARDMRKPDTDLMLNADDTIDVPSVL